ncbi:zinc-ribbon domain-containing protein [Actibacterium lipolyticum]|uniref:Zinc finger/thioredoxin putative domain-containing protein n=1 Tax=Actibacterium lipolyticum TaxID=1524263 RepID=A0A238KRU3_9RHOB|nr:zinc-ribbon domain-containing protein [Actibacterium lipolyticum]SMX45370.1 hypothetical protein COL8621_02777 [Actibacterium lipolyticum]
MRLVCPNCDATYEVDDSVIPENGRDVQCSNCGHTWFQHAADSEETGDTAQAIAANDDENPTPADDTTGLEDDLAAPPPHEPKKQELDDSVLDVLREEAERETKARIDEAQPEPLESQPDLGLETSIAAAAIDAKDRMDRMRSGVSLEDEEIDGPRRDLLPDIEEINSTLRASSDLTTDDDTYEDEDTDAAEKEAQANSNFGTGFSLMILLGMLVVAVYLLAPLISETVPAAEPYLAKYVSALDNLRIVMNAKFAALAEQVTVFLTSLTAE